MTEIPFYRDRKVVWDRFEDVLYHDVVVFKRRTSFQLLKRYFVQREKPPSASIDPITTYNNY